MRTEGERVASLAQCQYPALVALSGQLEVTALHDTLLDALGELLPGVALGLYLRDPRQDLWRGVVPAASDGGGEMPADIDALLARVGALPTGHEAGLVSPQGDYTAFPVYCGPRVLAAVLVGDRDAGRSDPLLQSVLSVYGNQLALLHRSRTDALTGLLNRQSFDESMARVFGDAAWGRRRQLDRRGRWCVALLDIDHFKQINDSFGHLYGDEVLLLFAQLMFRSFRDEDILFRYGGEEFVVLLADVDQELAARVLDRFRQTLEAYPFPQVGRVTVSTGFTIPDTPLPAAAILERADKALYYAKGHGRNQVHSYERLLAEGGLAAAPDRTRDVDLF